MGIILSLLLPYRRKKNKGLSVYGDKDICGIWRNTERFERLVEQMKQAQGITEQLKVENVLEWIGRMNNIQVCAREIVDKEIIYQEWNVR